MLFDLNRYADSNEALRDIHSFTEIISTNTLEINFNSTAMGPDLAMMLKTRFEQLPTKDESAASQKEIITFWELPNINSFFFIKFPERGCIEFGLCLTSKK